MTCPPFFKVWGKFLMSLFAHNLLLNTQFFNIFLSRFAYQLFFVNIKLAKTQESFSCILLQYCLTL